MKRRGGLSAEESGFASLVIAFVMILVLSLITVGFAQLMRREERNALDRQLSSQAYYASESGINDATKAINAGYRATKKDCGPLTATDPSATDPGANFLRNNNAGTNTAASYTCLLIDPRPTDLQYGSIPRDQSKIIEITGVDPVSQALTPIGTLNISWQDPSGSQDFVTGGATPFDTTANWTHTGVLRVGLTPLASGHLSRDDFTSDTYAAFLYPNASNAGPGSDVFAAGSGDNSGRLVKGNCNATTNTTALPRYCKVSIAGLNQVNYVATLRSVYKNTKVTITAEDFSGNQLDIVNAQTVVDSTGKAQDVLKRLQVRVPSHNNYDHSDYGLETMGALCKQLQLVPAGAGTSSTNCTP